MNNNVNVEKWINLVKETIQLKYANIAYKGKQESIAPSDIMENMDIIHDEIVDIIYNFPFDIIAGSILDSLCEYNRKVYSDTMGIIY